MSDQLKHLISTAQLHRGLLDELIGRAERIRSLDSNRAGRLDLKDLLADKRAILFFEQPSTRTFFSFASACNILGLSYAVQRDAAASSQSKGETFADTIHTMAHYVDLLILRHTDAKAIHEAEEVVDSFSLKTHLINAGSGDVDHPTQALLDVYTLVKRYEGNLRGKRIAVVGDLARGRAAKAFIKILLQYEPQLHFQLTSSPYFRMAPTFCEETFTGTATYEETSDFSAAVKGADIVYMTRVQNEWGGDAKASFVLDVDHLNQMHPNASILHPLPRREEISPDVDQDPRALYWQQEQNGLWVRCALLTYLFGVTI